MGNVITINHESCTGCKTCEMLCSLHHFGECNPVRSAIRIIRRERDGLVFCLPLVCQQCEPAPCVEACPTEAFSRDENNGTLAFNKEECTDCGLCEEACRIGCLTLAHGGTEIINCDLCRGEPQCVQACHAHCLTMAGSSEVDSKQNIEHIISILKQEGLFDRLPGREG
ncbi:MAG: 4Fe-4S dicluster domain-containing protein [Desulfobacteraceae bacterium]|nr:4Fe-4S dicluster domain-containing protein [Desulfobacteraceae bacterium]